VVPEEGYDAEIAPGKKKDLEGTVGLPMKECSKGKKVDEKIGIRRYLKKKKKISRWGKHPAKLGGTR